jgi:tRNA dimethylallyltransferase
MGCGTTFQGGKIPTKFADLKANEKTLIVIAGPTAVGKTDVALKIARHFQTEIISADSRQVYKELTIGTAKPTAQELALIPHHFVNTHSITETYDAAQYGDEALATIKTLFQRHDHVIVCGGSGLYIKGLLEGFDDIPEIPEHIREHLSDQYSSLGISWLQKQMMELDPEYYSQLDSQNPHRLIRALEVKIGTGESIGSFRKNLKRQLNFNVIKIGLELPREELYQRIDQRMDQMIADGLFEEAKAVYPYKNHQALQTVGYQEIFDFIDNKYDRNEAIRLLKRNSRRYAKRQLTWFKRDEGITWFQAKDEKKIIEYITS